jgi:precorrin-6A/cobalt-precorrin-6A reductase
MNQRILLLAGSAEARRIAVHLRAQGVQVQALVSEPPRGSEPMPVPCRLSAFDDVAALAIQMAGYDAVIDASHGFDGQMSRAGCVAAAKAGLPFISLSRPCWGMEAPNWCEVPDVRAAMPQIGAGLRVFSATGWDSLPDYADFAGAKLLLRQTTWHDRAPPFDFVELVFGDPPFSAAQEETLFRALCVDLLICRNLGGLPSRPKLEAAKALDLPVILIARPKGPAGAWVVSDVDAVLDWMAAL